MREGMNEPTGPDADYDRDDVTAERATRGPESTTEGTDVFDNTRASRSEGRDVTTNAENLDVEQRGETVVDHSRESVTHGTDVIDLGPAEGV